MLHTEHPPPLKRINYILHQGALKVKDCEVTMHVWDYLSEFSVSLDNQLHKDEKRWGDTWLKRPTLGMEQRTWDNYKKKFDAYFSTGAPISWLQIAGDALICWIHEKHPELWND
jgi:hypothetical protein